MHISKGEKEASIHIHRLATFVNEAPYTPSLSTNTKGVNILVDEGVLYKKRGIGMFVSAGAKEAILSRRKNEFYDNYVKKLLEEAASIGLGKEEVIQLIQSGNEA